MDDGLKATITWIMGLALLPGLFYLGLLSIENQHTFGPYFLLAYIVATYFALYGADKATEIAGALPLRSLPGAQDGQEGHADDGDDRQ